MNNYNKILVFYLDDGVYALHIHAVERIVRAVEVTVLPKAPDIVMGVINLQGKVIPVVNIRRRFGLPERDIELSDRFIIARASKKIFALIVDTIGNIIDINDMDIIAPAKITQGIELVEGIIKSDNGMILIHDLEKFLSLDEEIQIDRVYASYYVLNCL